MLVGWKWWEKPDGGVAYTSTFEALNRAEDFSVRLRTTETVTTKT
jgi:hypothetical protein